MQLQVKHSLLSAQAGSRLVCCQHVLVESWLTAWLVLLQSYPSFHLSPAPSRLWLTIMLVMYFLADMLGNVNVLRYVAYRPNRRCCCRPSQMRCLGHAHHGCVCYWPSKILYTHVPDAQLLAMKSLLQSLVKQVLLCSPLFVTPLEQPDCTVGYARHPSGCVLTCACLRVLQSSGSTPSGPLLTAMSRLATENKADRATMGNAHRKRKMAEAFPSSSNAVGITKLNPNSKTLPPLSMGQPQANAASGSQLQQPSFQGSLVSAAQPPSFARSTSQLLPGLPAMDARKRVKAESAAALSAPGVSFQSASKHSSGSKQAGSGRRAGTSKQASVSRQSSEDAQTRTDGSSRHTGSRQPSPQQADCVTSPPAANGPSSTPAAAPGLQPAAQMLDQQQVTFPFRIVKANAAQPASSSGLIGNSSVTHNGTARQATASEAAPTAAAVTQVSAVSASTAKPEVNQAAVSVGGQNCMDALAEAAAAASEGSAASSSSREHTDDDKDAAEILRDLHNSAGRPHNTTPDGGECTSAPYCQLSPDLVIELR